MSKLVSLAVSGAVLAVSSGAFGASAALNKDVTLVIDGVTTHVHTLSGTVAEVLRSQHLSLGEHDVVAPAVNAPVRNGSEVAVLYGRPVAATIDGQSKSLWTTARTVSEFMSQFAIRGESRVSTSRSTAIGREGMALTIDSAKQVVVKQGDKITQVSVPGTVGDALAAAGFTVGASDKVRPAADSALTEGETVEIVKVEKKQYTKTVNVPFNKVSKDDDSLDQGTTKVTQEGKDGSRVENWEQTLENGVVVNDTKVGDGDHTDPTDEVTSKGTKAPDAQPAAQTTQSSAPAQQQSAASTQQTTSAAAAAPAAPVGGSHQSWMAAAGIAPGDYSYVEALIARESGWNPNAVNASSGACGLVQALPCSKLGPNWNNPVVALQWANGYVARYGGWAGAWAHSQAYGWY